MRIQMRIAMTGTYNGVEYPPIGGEIEMTDHEAADMCAAGFAVPVVTEPKVERATTPAAEKRTARKRAQ